MIWWLALHAFSSVITGLSSSIPTVFLVTTLPYIDTYFSNGMATVYAILSFFPPAITMLHVSLAVGAYLTFKKITLRLLLGSRAPV